MKNLEDKNLVAFKYCDEKGDINKNSNPNGSSNNIAGILNNEKNILLIAGKGHESYQDISGRKLPFSDHEEVKKFLESM